MRQEFYTPPPLLYAPPTPRRVFVGVGGRVGGYKIRPRSLGLRCSGLRLPQEMHHPKQSSGAHKMPSASIRPSLTHAFSWRVPNPPGANPLVAERAFPTSDYWGRTGVARCAEEMRQESVGISSRLLTPCHTRLRRPPRALSATRGLAPGGLGTRQVMRTVRHEKKSTNPNF